MIFESKGPSHNNYHDFRLRFAAAIASQVVLPQQLSIRAELDEQAQQDKFEQVMATPKLPLQIQLKNRWSSS